MSQKTQKFPHITHFRHPNEMFHFECAGCHAVYHSGNLHTPAAFEAVKAVFEQIHKGCQDLTTRPLHEMGER